MSNPVYHAESSVRLFGGHISDYLPIHNWYDQTKQHVPNIRHRALRHHSFGIYQSKIEFGEYITIIHNDEEKKIPTSQIGEQHIIEDIGFIPTLDDWIKLIPIQSWMKQGRRVTNRLDIIRGGV